MPTSRAVQSQEVAVDWQEQMVRERNAAATTHTTVAINYTRPSARKHSPDGAARASKQTFNYSLNSIYRPRKDEKLSRPGWLVTLHTEIKCHLRESNPDTSSIPVLTGLDVE